MKYLVVHPEKCTGCKICSIACSLKKYGVCNPKKSAIAIVRDEFDRYEYPIVCLQCEEPICGSVCPQNALKKVNGVVKRDEERCIGCKLCVLLCPYSAINVIGGEIVQCDLCDGEPTCVKYCVTGAIEYVEETKALASRRKEFVKKLLSHFFLSLGKKEKNGSKRKKPSDAFLSLTKRKKTVEKKEKWRSAYALRRVDA